MFSVGFLSIAIALPLNDQIKEFRTSQKKFGTFEDREEAKRWGNRVYLVTYPRSGNHWMRYLIEEATGIATSSVYCDPDPPHLEEPFPWGGYCLRGGYEGRADYPDDIVVVKTHFPVIHISRFDSLPYKKAIRIIRHPVDSIYSLYVWAQKFGKRPIEEFVPTKRVLSSIRDWHHFQSHWDLAENVVSVRYEDLLKAPEENLKLILEEIGYKATDEDIRRAVAKYPPFGHPLRHKHHFRKEDLELIGQLLAPLMKEYGYSIDLAE